MPSRHAFCDFLRRLRRSLRRLRHVSLMPDAATRRYVYGDAYMHITAKSLMAPAAERARPRKRVRAGAPYTAQREVFGAMVRSACCCLSADRHAVMEVDGGAEAGKMARVFHAVAPPLRCEAAKTRVRRRDAALAYAGIMPHVVCFASAYAMPFSTAALRYAAQSRFRFMIRLRCA